ncbi:Heme oxygenase [Achromobacter xylosoxidans]|uniref:biliverdin-producing heme oxygenase n=1 Tax=Alcaligenes xylosoxydans xylosoxydans TaxID=85698 RepID=UPI0006C68D49|nr:biliverdin-producing heme oxygenase [Achromobacter xylosoxidans]CUJ05245.1 Heme oxygenase [Achromobacter xylosoxidans]CUJ16611.1 Heme oxygenase [Achromobacter xylosoxidans]
MISPVHQVLRDGTRERHEILDQGLGLADGDVGQARYLAYLRALLGWLEPVEQQLWQLGWPAAMRAPERDGKSALIRADLRDAGDSGAVPRCPAAPTPRAADAYALGVAYVVEGSQLGGRFLAKRLESVSPPLPLRYLRGYGEEVGPLWKVFLLHLDSAARGQETQALQGARDAFDSLTAWLRAQHALRGQPPPAAQNGQA